MNADMRDKLKARHEDRFGRGGGELVFSQAPGRIELAGNHTDHQGGRVLCAAADRSVYGLAAPNGMPRVRLWMQGYGSAELDLSDASWTQPREAERGSSAALVRGMLAAFQEAGGQAAGFDMVVSSDLPAGAGLSSSAAFEVMTGQALRALFSCDYGIWQDATALALAAVTAERDYFGKPCGAQDQLASAHGGMLFLDFSGNPPQVESVPFDLDACGHTFFIVDSGADHAHHTKDFTQITEDMHAVASSMGHSRLVDLDEGDFLDALGNLRASLGDGACLRALHFFDENARVAAQRQALVEGDFDSFLSLVRASGASSAQFLQNVSPAMHDRSLQPVMTVLALCSHLLGTRGAWRIHGGGFGGSVIAFVPDDMAEHFAARMEALLQPGCCMPVKVGEAGGRFEQIVP